jgi:uncharacterized protein
MQKEAKLALDKASVRSYDGDGHLHVSKTPISKANVCPYLGREIPNAEAMGLDPEKVYQLLRDPDELAKAAPTLNNKQLLFKHQPVSSKEPAKELTVGSTGTDAVFEYPYLYDSLVIWDAEAIKGVESNEQKELSAGYYYRADMTPGTFEGVPYDGVMRDIRFNHVALVVDGRAGSDVVVGDSMENLNMSKKKHLSPMAAMAKGALAVCLQPRLAQDAKINLTSLLLGVTPSNWGNAKTRIAATIGSEKNSKLFKNKLAQDAAVEEVVKLLNNLSEEDLGENPDADLGKDTDPDANLEGSEATGGTSMSKDSTKESVMALVRANMSPEDAAKIEELLNTMGEDENDEGENDKAEDDLEVKDPSGDEIRIIEELLAKLKGGAARDEDEIGKGAPLNIPAKPATSAQKTPEVGKVIDKAAMDAAIKAAERRTIERMNAIEEAKKAVKPFIGNVQAQDSAEAIYKLALDAANVDLEGVHPSAYKAMVKMLAQDSEQKKPGSGNPAMDGNTVSDFQKRFPDAGKIRHL